VPAFPVSPGLGAETRAMVRLALPLILTQIAAIGVNVLEIMLAGHLGPRVMGAVAVGTNVWQFAAMGVIGVMMALSPSVAQLDGAGRRVEAGPLFRQALWLGFMVGMLALVLLQLAGPLLIRAIGLEDGLAAHAIDFVRTASCGAPALAMYVGCRGLTEGLSMPRPSMLFGLLGLVILAPVGWTLMYPLGMGAFGTGIALSVTVWLQFGAFLAYLRLSRRYRGLDWARGARGPDWAAIGALFRLGGPMAVSILMESGMFSATALLIGGFGEVAVSGHQIALSVASVTFMVPLGLAIATTVRVGYAAGRGDLAGVRRAAAVGLGLALISQACAATLMLSLPGAISGLYTGDRAVVSFAAGLLFLAALFQLSDGAQVTAAAALRGLKDARVPMYMTTIAYWVVGMPLGWALTFPLGFGAPGMWWGLIVALSIAALLLWSRFVRMTAGLRLPVLEEPALAGRPAE
jgi:MATE family multidrug resistance protein